MIIREGIAPKLDKDVEEMCQTEPFSLMCDGGSEEGADKNFVILETLMICEGLFIIAKCITNEYNRLKNMWFPVELFG